MFTLKRSARIAVAVAAFALPFAVSASSVDLTSFATLNGENAGDKVGSVVAAAGDVNGDGIQDMLVSAYWDNTTGTKAGAVYLVYGSSDTTAFGSDVDLSTAAKFVGETAGDYAGYSIAAAGDVNNDGYSDFLVGAYLNDDIATDAGAAYLVYGQSTAYSGTVQLSEQAEFSGQGSGDYLGITVAGAGDVDGDGYSDMLFGSTTQGQGGTNAGAAYLVYGQSSAFTGTQGVNEVGVKFVGENSDDYAGIVAGLGDVNNDGYSDFAVGSRTNDEVADNSGTVYLMYGQTDHFSQTDLSAASAYFRSDVADEQAGYVFSAGDVNNDGYSDFFIGSTQDSTNGSNSGALFLIPGSAANYSGLYITGAAKSAAFYGAEGDLVGSSVSAADLNGDSLSDFVIGAFPADSVYIYYAPSTGVNGTINLSTDADKTLIGATDDQSGASVAVVDDVNSDATVDILVGAPLDAASTPGYVYVVTDIENALAPRSELDPNDTTLFDTYVDGLTGDDQGDISVTYTNGSAETYSIFNSTTQLHSRVAQYQDTGYVIVIDGTGKRAALVNAYTGEIYHSLKLQGQLSATNVYLTQFNLQAGKTTDDNNEVVVVTKRGVQNRLTVLTVNTSTQKLKVTARKMVVSKRVSIQDTAVTSSKITLRDSDDKTIRAYKVTKGYHLIPALKK